MSNAHLNADLHCHSTISDGMLPPEEVAQRAVANGVELWALTDHDNVAGCEIVRPIAEAAGVRYLTGVEVSVGWAGGQVHIVALNVDTANQALLDGLAGVRGGRPERARRMAADLARVGIGGALEGSLKYATDPITISRAHFARYLVEIGAATDVPSVFERYLAPGKPGYVDHLWPTLEQAVGWIHGAGGVAVVAHPARYGISRDRLKELLVEFRDLGGEAMEVQSGSDSVGDTLEMSALAQYYGFEGSRGSDFHSARECGVELGGLPPFPENIKPVWLRFL